MADLKISQLPDAAVPLEDEDYIPVVQGTDTDEPSTNKVRIGELRQAVEDLDGKLDNAFKFPVSEGSTDEHSAEILYPGDACYAGGYGYASGNKITGILEIKLPHTYFNNRIVKIRGKIERLNPYETINFQLGGYFSGDTAHNWWSIYDAVWTKSLNDLQSLRVRFGYTTIGTNVHPTIYIGEVTTEWSSYGSFVVEQASINNDPISDSQLEGMKNNWSVKIVGSDDIVSNLSTVFVLETDLSGYAKLDGGNVFSGIQHVDTLFVGESLRIFRRDTNGVNRGLLLIEDDLNGNPLFKIITDVGGFLSTAKINRETQIWEFIQRPSLNGVDLVDQNQLDLKLDASSYNDRFKGKYTSLINLQTAHPTADSGDYAQIDEGSGFDVINYNWDTENGWIEGGSGSAATTTDELLEGTTNLYFTDARAVAANNSLIAAKANDNNVMHLSGNMYENVTGQKNFNGYVVFNSGAFFGSSGGFTSDSSRFYISALGSKNLLLRTENSDIPNASANIVLNGDTGITIFNRRYEAQTINAIFNLPVQGVPAVSDNQFVTLAQLNASIIDDTDLVHKTSDETINGDKTFTGVTSFNGNVGMDVSNPTYPLHVNGVAKINEAVISGYFSCRDIPTPGFELSPTIGSSYILAANVIVSGAGIYDNTTSQWRLVVKDGTGNVVLGSETDDEINKLQVNGTISAAAPTVNNQVATKGYVDSLILKGEKFIDYLPSIPANSGVTFTISVPNAAVGDAVSLGTDLGQSLGNAENVWFQGRVAVPNLVVIRAYNPNSSATTLPTFTCKVRVIK